MRQLFSLRKSLREYGAHFNKEQRRSWLIQRLRLTPRVNVGIGYIPPSVARQFHHIDWLRGGA